MSGTEKMRKLYSTGETKKRICNIMSSSSIFDLHSSLDQAGVTVTQEIVEDVLTRFKNAGKLAYQFFQWAKNQKHYNHRAHAYHIMIDSLARIRQYRSMWELVNSMGSKRLLSVETFCVMIRKYARAKKVEEAIYAFNVMEKYGVSPDMEAFNCLLAALCKRKNVREAQEIFDRLKGKFSPDAKSHSILIQGWGKARNLSMAREMFREMEAVGCSPDGVTFTTMVDVLCKCGRLEEAMEMVKEMRSRDPNQSLPYVYCILIHAHGSEGRVEDAVQSFLEIEKNGIRPDTGAYNALIQALCKARRFKSVSRVLRDMGSNHVTPNSRTYDIIIHSLMEHGDTSDAVGVFRRMMGTCEPGGDSYTMMIKLFCGRGEIEKALALWGYMKKRLVPSVHAYAVLIDGLCDKKDASRACELLEEMIESGICPPEGSIREMRKLLFKEGREDVMNFLQAKLNAMLKESQWN